MKKSRQNGGFCSSSSSSPQGPVAEAALPAHSHAGTYFTIPTTSASAAPQWVCAAHPLAPWLTPQPALVPLGPVTAGYALLGGAAFSPQVRDSCTGAHVHAQAHTCTNAASCMKSNSNTSWHTLPAPLFFQLPISTPQRMREQKTYCSMRN